MKKYLFMLGSAIAFVVAMSACGHNSDSGSNATTACTANAAGCVYSNQYGWLTQGSCQVGQGWYNNTCVWLNGTGGYGNTGYYNNGYYGGGYYGNTNYYPQTGLYATPYYTYPVMYGGGYYGGGCNYRSHLGGFINTWTCY
jgi:hypothetical protein